MLGVEFFPNSSINHGESSYFSETHDKLSASFGVALSYTINNRFAFETGLRYVNKGQVLKGYREDIFYLVDYLVPIDYSQISESNRKVQIHNYNFVSVPLGIRYSFDKSLDKGWFLSAALSPSLFFSSQKVTKQTNTEGEQVETKGPDESDIRKTHLNLNVGVGYAFLINDKYQLSVEPGFEYMFYKMFHKRSYDELYHALGVNFRFMIL